MLTKAIINYKNSLDKLIVLQKAETFVIFLFVHLENVLNIFEFHFCCPLKLEQTANKLLLVLEGVAGLC